MVFGCPGAKHRKARVLKAVALYKQGVSSKILFSGGNVKGVYEAIEMKKDALQLGVSEKDILIEETSLNTCENIIASLIIIERAFHLANIKSILLVSDEAYLQRVLLTAKKYLPSFIHFHGVKSSYTIEKETEENLVIEAKKLVAYAKKGYIADEI